jgi:hypothetical protein
MYRVFHFSKGSVVTDSAKIKLHLGILTEEEGSVQLTS